MPQMFSQSFPFHAVIPKKPLDDNKRRILWKTVMLKDFIPVKGSVFSGLGQLCPEAIETFASLRTRMETSVEQYFQKPSPHAPDNQLKILASQLRTTYQRIAYVPAKYPDIVLAVSLFQRLWLEIQAWISYRQVYYDRTFAAEPYPVETELMGAWSFHLHEVQKLHNAGIPVWWIRSEETITENTNIISQIHISEPSTDIVLEHFEDEHDVCKPFPVFHNGFPGDDHMGVFHWAVQYHLDPVRLDSESAPRSGLERSILYDLPPVRQVVGTVDSVGSADALRQVVRDVVQECLEPQSGPDRPSASQPSTRVAPYGRI